MKKKLLFFILIIMCQSFIYGQLRQMGPNDTIPVLVYHIDNDSFPYKYGEWVTVVGKLTEGAKVKIK